MKQKNRFIEDRYRHRMMENMGADSNYSTVADSVSGQSTRWTIDGLDQRYVDCDWGKSIWDVHLSFKGDFEPGKTFDIERARAMEIFLITYNFFHQNINHCKKFSLAKLQLK